MSNFICEEIKLCTHCNEPTRKDLKFCNKSCAAKHNNKNRKMSAESKAIISKKLVGREPATKGKVLHEGKFVEYDSVLNLTSKYKCVFCSKTLSFKMRDKKTCSETCYRQHISMIHSERLKNPENRKNYGRGKKSYLETSFEEWLKSNDFNNYQIEYHFYNKILNKNYYVDFIFEDRKLIVELDGTQHRKTVESDRIRDEYLTSLGYRVIRITYKEYRNKTRINEILEILARPEGVEPPCIQLAFS